MRKIDNPSTVENWSYWDQKLGRGFAGTRNHIIFQVQQAYVENNIQFEEGRIPMEVDDYMCDQNLAAPCSDIEESAKIKGLGDLVAYVARPIAGIIDKVAGTNISNCSGCAKRQQQLNEQVPL